jgi:hypothetical protein
MENTITTSTMNRLFQQARELYKDFPESPMKDHCIREAVRMAMILEKMGCKHVDAEK